MRTFSFNHTFHILVSRRSMLNIKSFLEAPKALIITARIAAGNVIIQKVIVILDSNLVSNVVKIPLISILAKAGDCWRNWSFCIPMSIRAI